MKLGVRITMTMPRPEQSQRNLEFSAKSAKRLIAGALSAILFTPVERSLLGSLDPGRQPRASRGIEDADTPVLQETRKAQQEVFRGRNGDFEFTVRREGQRVVVRESRRHDFTKPLPPEKDPGIFLERVFRDPNGNILRKIFRESKKGTRYVDWDAVDELEPEVIRLAYALPDQGEVLWVEYSSSAPNQQRKLTKIYRLGDYAKKPDFAALKPIRREEVEIFERDGTILQIHRVFDDHGREIKSETTVRPP